MVTACCERFREMAGYILAANGYGLRFTEENGQPIDVKKRTPMARIWLMSAVWCGACPACRQPLDEGRRSAAERLTKDGPG